LRQSTARNNSAFFLKALFESSGEIEKILFVGDQYHYYDSTSDSSILAVSVHLGDVEIGIAEQIRTIKKRTGQILQHVDLDASPLESDCAATNIDNALWRFQSAREKTFYLMYELSKKEWAYQGQHPYRGKMSILDLARDLYHHDLEHLWQIRKLATGKLW
tara:strand:+ start:1001 stop:1483 length:483 start_codon:yes stop_codon:yes gene_type:complete